MFPGFIPLKSSFHLFLYSCLCICYYIHPSNGLSINTYNNIRCIDSEREALLTFKHGIEADYYRVLSYWGHQQNNQDCCKWHSVRCSNRTGHVIMLDLHDCFLVGNLSTLVELKQLKYLDLSSNNFLGQPIPAFVGSLSKLRHLNLSNSVFAGEIPHQLGNLSRLSFLDLSYNYKLYANDLHWLSHLTLLKHLNLRNTYLIEAKDWFQAINNIPFLRVLHLDLCLLPSAILPRFSHINSSSNLAVITLSGNFLNDSSIFQWLFNLSGIDTHLVHVDFSQNSLSGPIPSAFGKMRALSYLDLSNNQLQGSFSSAFGNMSSLTYLDLSHNLLAGFISDSSIGRLKSLAYLKLSDNSFSGPIPDAIRNLQSLTYLRLSNNLLSAPIADAISNLKSLEYLDLSNNSISSNIPDFIGYMLNLTYLDLSHNMFTGVIPSQLDKHRLLNSLDLSFNRLSGPIPSALWKFPAEVFLGNLHLCGEPLPEDCPVVEGGDSSSQHNENETGNSDSFYIGLYVCAGLGFYIGLWGVCGTLVLNHSWRYAYFQWVDNIINKVYVTIAIYLARFYQRNSHMQNM